MTDKNTVLKQCLGQNRKISELIEYASNSIVSKTLLDKTVGTITLFAFDKGQKLSEHTTPYDAVVQILDGRGKLKIAAGHVTVSVGKLS